MEVRLYNLIRKRKEKLSTLQSLRENAKAGNQWIICPKCQEKVEKKSLKERTFICPLCGHYFPISAKRRIDLLADAGSFHELFQGIKSKDPLAFPEYENKLQELEEKIHIQDAIITGTMKLSGEKAAIGVLDSRFLMGSMGTVVGEKIALLAEYAAKKNLPLILFSASGGARMQEGLFSLMQMAKTAAAIEKYKRSGGLFLSCLTHPTTGGVSASYASLGDYILAEPRALIGFAGPRVIEQTIGEKLPEGFQKAEFLLEHGMIDGIVEREKWRETLSSIIKIHKPSMG